MDLTTQTRCEACGLPLGISFTVDDDTGQAHHNTCPPPAIKPTPGLCFLDGCDRPTSNDNIYCFLHWSKHQPGAGGCEKL